MAIAIVEELWARIRAAIDDKIVAAEDAAVRAEAGAAVVGGAQTVLTARGDTVAAVATLGDAQTVLTARDESVTAAGTAEGIATALPTTIQSELDTRLPTELDTRVPPLVADTIAAEQTIVDAATAAVSGAVEGMDLMERTTAEGLIAAGKWDKGQIPSGSDLNEMGTSGIYHARTYAISNSLINRPTYGGAVHAATLEVKALLAGQVVQTWSTASAVSAGEAPVLTRRRDNIGAWSPWVRVDSPPWQQPDVTLGADLNAVRTSGVYRVPTYTVANSLINRPTLSGATNGAILAVNSLSKGDCEQVWTTLRSAELDSPIMRRRRDDTGTWTEWERVDENSVDPLQPVGMVAKASEGESAGLRTILRRLSPEAEPVWSWWAPPGPELTIPTHEGSGQGVHPSVIHFPGGWNGWKYWMAVTPYPYFQEQHEDPNILVSDNGTDWQVPDGLVNPLDDQPGRPGPHNSDTHLAMMGATMVCSWRMVDRSNNSQNIIYARTSTDGIVWTPKVEVMKVPLGTQDTTFVSQALVKMPTGWRLYGIRSVPAPNQLVYFESETDDRVPTTAEWGPAQVCDIGSVAAGRDPWHVDVQRLAADDWAMVMSDGLLGTTGTSGDIYLGRSTDGITWEVSPLPLTPRGTGVLDSLYKTGFIVSGTGPSRTLDLYVSGYRTDRRTWGIYRTTAIMR